MLNIVEFVKLKCSAASMIVLRDFDALSGAISTTNSLIKDNWVIGHRNLSLETDFNLQVLKLLGALLLAQ